ncbi:MAG: hypothetical protein HUK15_07665 [Bacteroidales bacterium]|nr:hypothetical protein [Bacteroidales bacterium]
MKIVKGILVLSSMILLFGCSNLAKKDMFLKSFENFVNEVSNECANYTDADWDEADMEYKNFVDVECPKYYKIMTDEDKSKVGQLKGRYAALQAKRTLNGLLDGVKGFFDELGGYVEGVTEEINNN